MKKFCVAVIALATLLPAIPTLAVAADPPAVVDLPELIIGDKWERSNGRTYEIAGVENDYTVRYVSSTSKGFERWNKKNLGNFTFQLDGRSIQNTYDPAPELFRFPLSVGQKWDYSYRNLTVGATFHRSVKVEDWEEVKVPAGTFRALRIRSDGRRTDTGYQFTEVYWYAPEVRGLVKATSDVADARSRSFMDFELVKFTPGPGAQKVSKAE